MSTLAFVNRQNTVAAILCHEANRAFCLSIGDTSQVPWDDAPEEIQLSVREGILQIVKNPNTTSEESHASWMQRRLQDGWVHGAVKDREAKTHPCLVPYSELGRDHQTKDQLFGDVARQALKTWGPRQAFYKPHRIEGYFSRWDTTDPVFEHGMNVIVGRMASVLAAAIAAVDRSRGYDVPPDPLWSQDQLQHLHYMLTLAMHANQERHRGGEHPAESAYRAHRRSRWPMQMMMDWPILGYDQAKWHLAVAIARTVCELEGVEVFQNPEVSRERWASIRTAAWVARSKVRDDAMEFAEDNAKEAYAQTFVAEPVKP